MTSRNFRDRYHSIAGLERPQRRETDREEWPLPRGGTLQETPYGSYALYERFIDGEGVEIAREQLLGRPGTRSSSDYLFLDTETTGLAGGTGTYAFLVGIGRFVDGGFAVRQYFMRHPGDEPGLLHAIEAELAGADTTLVTYNGRTFDIPLLETRFRMHHRSMAAPVEHLDLLGPARAIWKHRLPSCSLGSIESLVLGIERELDAPGWMIPSIYFGYLQHRRPDDLEPVLEHNSIDISTLARVTALVHAYREGNHEPDHPIDRLAVALYRFRSTPCGETLDCLRSAWRYHGVPADLRYRALRELSIALKRDKRHVDALPEWRDGLNDPSRMIRLYAAEELAKYLEHRQRDYQEALRISHQAADGARLARDSRWIAAFEHRIARLEQKAHAQRIAEQTIKEQQ